MIDTETARDLIERAINPTVLQRRVAQDSMFADLNICAVDRVCIAEAVLDEFGFEPADDEYEAWGSVDDVVALVRARVGA